MYVVIAKYVYPPLADWKRPKDADSVVGSKKAREDYINRVLGFQMLKSIFRGTFEEINKTAKTGQKAPNETVVSPDGKTYKKILYLQQKDRPLVLNFGSCT